MTAQTIDYGKMAFYQVNYSGFRGEGRTYCCHPEEMEEDLPTGYFGRSDGGTVEAIKYNGAHLNSVPEDEREYGCPPHVRPSAFKS